jgi:hypothetical protein
MLYEDFMYDVEGSSNKGNTFLKNLLMSNENNDQHDLFKFPNDDPSKGLLFSKLLSNANIWELNIETLMGHNATQCHFVASGTPTSITCIKHQVLIETPHASTMVINAPMVDDQFTQL